jgi:hypothetical protein
MIVGISLGHRELRQADGWIAALRPVPEHACTHLVRDPYPHVAISLAVGPDTVLPEVAPDLRPAAAAAAAAHGRSGRAVRYPGVDRLVGVVTVAEILGGADIEEIAVLGGGTVGPDDEIVTRDFVRPQWVDGVLTLLVQPTAGGRYVPFEVADPTPCCAAH